jgi:hypothetical protein
MEENKICTNKDCRFYKEEICNEILKDNNVCLDNNPSLSGVANKKETVVTEQSDVKEALQSNTSLTQERKERDYIYLEPELQEREELFNNIRNILADFQMVEWTLINDTRDSNEYIERRLDSFTNLILKSIKSKDEEAER